MARSLRVLVTNLSIAGHRGARTVTRDLLTGLLKAGHRPMLYARSLGPLAEELRAQSIPVADDIASIRETPDIIHGQHHPTTTLAVARFPQVPAIFHVHGFDSWQDAPPLLPQVRRYAAISDGFRERLTVEGGVDPAAACVVLNAVDLDRYRPGPPLPERPRKALAFAKNLGHLAAIEAACAEAGIELDLAGGQVKKVIDPAAVMGGYDLVFTSALTAMEAMAMGRAVVVCDGRGLAGMVDPERYSAWRRENFGLRALRQPLTAAAMAAEIARYDAGSAAQVCAQVRAECGLPQWIEAWEQLYEEAIAEHRASPPDPDEAARAMARHLQAWSSEAGPGFPWTLERARLIEQAGTAASDVAALDPGEEAAAGDLSRMQLHGFWLPEKWGVWSARDICAVGVVLGERTRRLTLHYRVHFGPRRKSFAFEALVNGMPLDRWTVSPGAGPLSRTLEIPEELAGPGRRLWLGLRTSAPVKPAKDPRALGFGLERIAAD